MYFRRIFTATLFAILVYAGYRGQDYVRSPEAASAATDYGMGTPFTVKLSGTGSMYPTFPKGTGKTIQELAQQTVAEVPMYAYPTGFTLFNNRYFAYTLERGDIVSFENAQTKKITLAQSGEEREFLKRIIALPGDTVEFRDGITYLNDVPQKEPYIARARSTFGGEFLGDCKKLTIPDGKLFVMGDNRKVSSDSRAELGLVSYDDINAVIPFVKQKGKYDSQWRDTSFDLEESEKIHLVKQSLIESINAVRAEQNLKPLKINAKLEKSAEKRGDVILQYEDLSPEASRSGYTMAKAMKEVGYSNITWSEFPLLGYYDNDEYLEAVLEYPKLKKVFTDKDFQDIGIAEVTENVHGCPAHVIVTQFGGYIPPTYTIEQIQSWKDAEASLRDVYPSWQRVMSSGAFYEKHKVDVDRVLYLFDLRIKNISGIVSAMEANKWLTDEQLDYVKKDSGYGAELDQLTKKLNTSE